MTEERNSDPLEARIFEIRTALSARQLCDGEKLRLFLTNDDVDAVAALVSGGVKSAETVLLKAAKKIEWAPTFTEVNRKLNTPRGRPADYYTFAVVHACCDFWKSREGGKLAFSRPASGGKPGGPLIRFIRTVHDRLIGTVHSVSDETFADHIKLIREDKTSPFDPLRNS